MHRNTVQLFRLLNKKIEQSLRERGSANDSVPNNNQ